MLLNCGVGEKTLESPLDCQEIQPIHPKGNQSWIFIGRIVAEAATPILWPADAKNWLIWKDPDALKDWRQEEKGMTEDEMVWWHHWLSGREFEQAPGDTEGQGSLVCCSPWDCKELDKTEHWIIEVFELQCWIRLLRAPWTARKSNQSILKEINPEYSLEGLMLKF